MIFCKINRSEISMEELSDAFVNITIAENPSDIYISSNENDANNIMKFINNQSHIDDQIKNTICNLLMEDSYPSYEYIYSICLENNIELPPML